MKPSLKKYSEIIEIASKSLNQKEFKKARIVMFKYLKNLKMCDENFESNFHYLSILDLVANSYLQEGNFDKANRILITLQKRFPNEFLFKKTFVDLLLSLKDFINLQAFILEQFDKNCFNSEFEYNFFKEMLALSYLYNNQYHESENILKEVSFSDSNNCTNYSMKLLLNIIGALIDHEMYDISLPCLSNILVKSAMLGSYEYIRALLIKGRYDEKIGNLKGALKSFEDIFQYCYNKNIQIKNDSIQLEIFRLKAIIKNGGE